MHIQQIRRHSPLLWRVVNRVGLWALALAGGLILAATQAHGSTPVEYLRAEQEVGYDALRSYAGRTVARRAAELAFKQSGTVAAVEVDTGSRVRTGDLIARLDGATLEARLAEARADVRLAEAGLAAAHAAKQLAAQTEARFRSLNGTGHVSAQSYDEQRLTLAARQAEESVASATVERARASLAAAQIALAEASILAPFDGTVQQRHLDEGSQAAAGQPVIRLVEVNATEAHVGIPERLAAQLEPQAGYQLRWGSHDIPGTLRAVLPEVDPGSRTLTAVFELETSTVPLGAVIELELRSTVAEPGFWLPLTALTASDRGLWDVFVINEASEIERRLVEIVHVEAREAYVRGTLQSGDRVVTTGVNRLVDGQRVTLARSG